MRHVADNLINLKEHIGGRRLLTQLAIDLKLKIEFLKKVFAILVIYSGISMILK